MVWRNAGEICEREILFRMKKKRKAGFKDTRTGLKKLHPIIFYFNQASSKTRKEIEHLRSNAQGIRKAWDQATAADLRRTKRQKLQSLLLSYSSDKSNVVYPF